MLLLRIGIALLLQSKKRFDDSAHRQENFKEIIYSTLKVCHTSLTVKLTLILNVFMYRG